MMNDYNEQEAFWSSNFGDGYIERNKSELLRNSNVHLFRKIFQLSLIDSIPKTVLELGANIGMNLHALREIFPVLEYTGIEINKTAAQILEKLNCEVINSSILEANITKTFDLVFSKGVLIHINPRDLPQTYEKIYKASAKWILLIEYYNPTPVQIEYRGNLNKLFKRDFAGEMLEKFPDLKLVDYGFAYHLDRFPQDDCTWFLLSK
jgi:spore coat polysaccharide biosynthesis protein SpsF